MKNQYYMITICLFCISVGFGEVVEAACSEGYVDSGSDECIYSISGAHAGWSVTNSERVRFPSITAERNGFCAFNGATFMWESYCERTCNCTFPLESDPTQPLCSNVANSVPAFSCPAMASKIATTRHFRCDNFPLSGEDQGTIDRLCGLGQRDCQQVCEDRYGSGTTHMVTCCSEVSEFSPPSPVM